MARPKKAYLDYFPWDCDTTQQLKIKKFMRRCENGIPFLIYVRILERIYGGKGYFLPWDDDVAFTIGDECGGIESEFVENVVGLAVEMELFDEDIFEEYHVLTSVDIQMTYFAAIKNAKRVGYYIYNPIMLIAPTGKDDAWEPIHDECNDNYGERKSIDFEESKENEYSTEETTQRKVNKKKGNEITSNEITSNQITPNQITPKCAPTCVNSSDNEGQHFSEVEINAEINRLVTLYELKNGHKPKYSDDQLKSIAIQELSKMSQK